MSRTKKQSTKKQSAQPQRASDKRESIIARDATALLSADGVINQGSRASRTQALAVLDAVKRSQLGVSTKNLRAYARPSSAKDQAPARKLSEGERKQLVQLTKKIGDRQIWPRKVAAIVVGIRKHPAR